MSSIYLQHHGIKGQKWGVRRFQSKSGNLTSEGRERYNQEAASRNQRKQIAIAVGATAAATIAVYSAYKLGVFDNVAAQGKQAVDNLLKSSFGKKQLSSSNDGLKIGVQFFAKSPAEYKTVRLPKAEYAHVMSEIMTHITPRESKEDVFYKYIGKYQYMVHNLHDGTYRIIGKYKSK